MGVRTLLLLTISSLCGCVCYPGVTTVGPQPPNIMPPPPPIIPMLRMMLPTPANVPARPGVHTNAGTHPVAAMNPQYGGPVAPQPMVAGYQQHWAGQNPMMKPTLRQRFMNITRNRSRNVQRTGPTINRSVYAPKTKYVAPRNNRVRNVMRDAQQYGSDDYWYAQASLPESQRAPRYHEATYTVREPVRQPARATAVHDPDCAAPRMTQSSPPHLNYKTSESHVQKVQQTPHYEVQHSQPQLQPCPCTGASQSQPVGQKAAPRSGADKPPLVPPSDASVEASAEKSQPATMPDTEPTAPAEQPESDPQAESRRAYESGVEPQRLAPPPTDSRPAFGPGPESTPPPSDPMPQAESEPQTYYRRPTQQARPQQLRHFTPQPINPRKYQVSQAKTQGGFGIQKMSLSVPMPAPAPNQVRPATVPQNPVLHIPVSPEPEPSTTLRVPEQTPPEFQPAGPAIQIPEQRVAFEPDSVFVRRIEE